MDCVPLMPFVLLIPLAIYIIWDQMQWNKIHEERKKIYKDLRESLQAYYDSLNKFNDEN